MSGDVQPRKRKDKKKKKDDLSFEEPSVTSAVPVHPGTTAIFGEGDVFMHSYSDHGTGGHWCAKVIFFSLLAVLITLIGLIILENRGLSELEANAVESRYSGVLEGWLEDLPDDDHHDVHTLELKHPDHDDEEHDDEHAEDDDGDDDDDHEEEEDDHADEGSREDAYDEEHDDDTEEDQEQDDKDNSDEDDDNTDDDEDDDRYEEDEQEEQLSDQLSAENDEDGQKEQLSELDSAENYEDEGQDTDEDEDDERNYADEDNDDSDEVAYRNLDEDDIDDEVENNQPYENNDADDDINETQEDEDEDGHDDNDDDDDDEEEEPEVELERIEREPTDEEPISNELPALPEADDDDEDDKSQEDADDDNSEEESPDDDDFLQHDDLDNEPPAVVERITAPSGKPFQEVEDDDDSNEQPVDTLADEEEYEKRQEELRQEAEAASHLWLKLGVGGALVLATYAVVSKCAAPRADEPEEEEESVREETTLSDRRMTLIPEPQTPPAPPKPTKPEPLRKVIQEEDFLKKIPSIIQSSPTPKQVSLEEEGYEDEEEIEELEAISPEEPENKELYSEDEVEEEEEEEIPAPKKEAPIQSAPLASKNSPKEPDVEEPEEDNGDLPDDVEIIEDEELEEELEEEEDDEEISDVDDVELLSRLEAKYGRLPEPERYGFGPPKDGGNSVSDDWPGEPGDPFWREQLDSAEQNLRQGSWMAAAALASKPQLSTSARARWVVAKAYDSLAEAEKHNSLLSRAIAAYLELLKMNESLSDKKLLEITERTLNRIKFAGKYLSAEPVYRLLIRRFPKDPTYRNELTISFLMANRGDLAVEVLNETLQLWPNDAVALAHYAFLLKTQHNRFEEAVELLQKALRGDSGPAHEPRFFYHLGDALLLLNRFADANEVHKRGARLGHFLSPSQRSLYNVNRLKGKPWWNVEETPYSRMARALEKSWKEILKEGEAARALFEVEREGLKERGEWSQLDLFARGREIPDRCKRAPVTCSIVKAESAAWGCRRGQVKFSTIEPGTHIRPHVGPTNCRLRMHLGLKNTKDTFLRVDKETRQWRVGSVLIFDDSFEHEVWHNGTGSRLVLIVDVWHPDLTPDERRTLPAI